MNKSDKLLIAGLFGVLTFELGPDLWKQFEKSVLHNEPLDRRPFTERLQQIPAPDNEKDYRVTTP